MWFDRCLHHHRRHILTFPIILVVRLLWRIIVSSRCTIFPNQELLNLPKTTSKLQGLPQMWLNHCFHHHRGHILNFPLTLSPNPEFLNLRNHRYCRVYPNEVCPFTCITSEDIFLSFLLLICLPHPHPD